MSTVNEKMTAIADAIRDKTGSIDALTLDGMAEEIANVYEAGKQAQYDEFWDSFQDYGNRTNYHMAFGNVGWTDETFKPKYKIKPVASAYRMLQNSCVTDLTQCGVEVDFSESKDMQMLFYNSQFEILGIIDARSTTTLDNTFGYATKLETIEKLILKDDGTAPLKTNTFDYCNKLRNIAIEGKIGVSVSFARAPKLTYESLMSIITALKDYSGTSTAYTLTLHADSKAKLSESEIAIATQKGWTLA